MREIIADDLGMPKKAWRDSATASLVCRREIEARVHTK
jgi:hypothetical protein